ncbi:Heavy metal transport/detoxification superfamily protein [Rhynchospora pubera]|uniref:Heavy metal transport/detoxification superfamily protein n=1 Tax=Rhynchospora pubera TaxID=906938 RepID=A0AAV8GP68_9POAL|nr:Heavy metal transport/detoxification superfamily protein [Rhynchospora pubera]
MGEEVKKEEEAKAEVKEEGKKEEAKGEEEKKEEAKGEEEKKEEPKAEEPPQPPPPVVLQVDLHCVGCAKKIQRSILKCKGVEGVEVEMGKNLVTVKGIVDPQALCNRIQKKTMRKATIISPVLPPPPPEGDSAQPLVVLSQVNEATTTELKVNMHCEACAQQLQKKIQRIRGVQTVETNLGAAKVMVTGTVPGEKLVEYVYRRTGKLATVIPPPPPPKEEEKKEESEKPAEEKPAEEKKEEGAGEKKDEEKPPEEGKEKAEGDAKEGDGKEEKGGGDAKKEGEIVVAANNAIWHGGYMNHGFLNGGYMNNAYMHGGYMNEEDPRRMMMMNLMPMPAVAMPMPMHMPMHMPVYMIEQPPPPQIFSDENPNACRIT